MINITDITHKPSLKELSAYVHLEVWDALLHYIETTYEIKPRMEFSKCALPGWNLKYRKGAKSLCILYPMKGHFTCLIVINDRQVPRYEEVSPFLSLYTQGVYDTTKHGMKQRWLMLEIKDIDMLKDIQELLNIRVKS